MLQPAINVSVSADDFICWNSQADDTRLLRVLQRAGFAILLSLILHLLLYKFFPTLTLFGMGVETSQAVSVRVLLVDAPEKPQAEPRRIEAVPAAPVLEKASDALVPEEDIVVVENPQLTEADYQERSAVPSDAVNANSSNSLRIFDPRLRRSIHGEQRSSMPNINQEGLTEPGSANAIVRYNMHYYELGGGDCLREYMDGYGIENRNSEEYLMMNVRKVRCPGRETETEGEAMIRGLRAALKKKNLNAQKK